MLRTSFALLVLALALAPTSPASASGVDKCVFGNSGICVVVVDDCAGIGFGLQAVGVCVRGDCVTVFVGFNEIGTCGGTIVLP